MKIKRFERATIDLAIWQAWQAFYQDNFCGHQVVRQLLLQVTSQIAYRQNDIIQYGDLVRTRAVRDRGSLSSRRVDIVKTRAAQIFVLLGNHAIAVLSE